MAFARNIPYDINNIFLRKKYPNEILVTDVNFIFAFTKLFGCNNVEIEYTVLMNLFKSIATVLLIKRYYSN